LALVLGLLSAGGLVVAINQGYFVAALWCAALAIDTAFIAYVFQDQPLHATVAGEYSAVIDRIGEIGVYLSQLSVFLERERARIADTEATVRKLHDEKLRLEPIVSTQRETIEAILAIHAERTARNAWKERVFGF